ncbi:MAG TPA: hypothetical protein VF515_10740 [Candidatus Binatia bacterium]
MATTTEDTVAYCNCMEQVKRRLRLVAAITGGMLKTGDEGADAEFACLQLRKVLELIAFATLAANRERYSQARADVDKEWSAKRILERLARMNPDFYPVPVIPISKGPGRWHFDIVADGFLTQSDFAILFDKCSEVVHEWNPFRAGPRLVDFGRSISEWARRIERLLEVHHVRLIDQPDILLVRLTDPADGKAHVFSASPRPG